jgi:hypothetical protein
MTTSLPHVWRWIDFRQAGAESACDAVDGDHPIEACWGAPDGTEEGDKLDVLLVLVNIYESKRWPIEIDETFDPIDVLR